MLTSIAWVIAYLLGSLSSAIIVCRLLKLPDPRCDGSGNPGATNVLRIAGKRIAIAVLVGDMFKGVLAILLAKAVGVSGIALGMVMLSVLLGHIFPVFFGFKGGKGVATVGGALLALTPTIGSLACVVWILVLVVTRYSSLAALVAAVTAVCLAQWFAPPAYVLPIILATVILVWRHKVNIERLLDGTETKVRYS